MFSGKRMLFIGLAVLMVANFVRLGIAETSMKQGKNAYYNQRDYDLAISACTRADKLTFWDKEKKAENLLWRGRAYYEKQDYAQALADFAKAIDLQPDYPYYIWRARTYYKMGNYDLAMADFSKSIEIQNNDFYSSVWDTYLERANAYFLNKDYVLAIADYDFAISALDKKIISPYTSPDKIDELKKKRENVVSIKKESDNKMVIAMSTEAIRLNPNDAVAYYNRGMAHNNKGDYNQAIADFSQAIRLNPNDAATYYNRGNAYNNKGYYDQAVADYDLAISALDKKIISPYTSSDEIDELKKKRKEIEWKKNNPGKGAFQRLLEWAYENWEDANGN